MWLCAGNGIISETNRDNIRAHNLRLMSNLSRRAFNQFRYTFAHKLNIDSLYVIDRRLALLSGISAVLYDCCINSCIVYTRNYLNHTHCPFCREPRRHHGKA